MRVSILQISNFPKKAKEPLPGHDSFFNRNILHMSPLLEHIVLVHMYSMHMVRITADTCHFNIYGS